MISPKSTFPFLPTFLLHSRPTRFQSNSLSPTSSELKVNSIQIVRMVSDSEDEFDDEQLEEYKEMIEELGTFPDKVKINTLSMVAEDHAESSRNATAIYGVIRKSLISIDVHCDRKLPLVYLVDSILKNVKGEFIPIVENDAANWLPVVYGALPEEKRAKLEKVWNLWNKGGTSVFAREKWEEMGRCFSEKSSSSNGMDTTIDSELSKTGLTLGVRQLLFFDMIACFKETDMHNPDIVGKNAPY